jgi:NADH dehydrogenase
MGTRQKICILGGGFGGLYTALRLNELSWQDFPKPEIILIDKSDRFLFSPLLYELITEELQAWEIAPPYSELLAETEVRFIQDTVNQIEISNRQINLANHGSLTYDRLAIALGGKTPIDLVKGATDYAIPFRTLNDAFRVKEKLRYLENSDRDKIRVAIVGGGYSGVELALKIADRLGSRGRIRIIERGEQILKQAPKFNQEASLKALEEQNIWLDLETEVEEIQADSLSLGYKGKTDHIPVDLVLWTIGTKIPPQINNFGLPQSDKGKLITTPTLQIEGNSDIFALGDLAESKDEEGKALAATAQVAFQQSDYCAWNIWASLHHKPLLPFRYQPLGEMLTLGIDNATLSALGIQFDGFPASVARRLIYLYRLPTLKHQLSVALNWVTSPLLNLVA